MMSVELVDDGFGYPDSMAGDGIYSGLLTLVGRVPGGYPYDKNQA